MFDAWLEESLRDPSALLHLAADTLDTERAAGCRKLRVATAWADCHGAPAELELIDGEPAQSLCEERYLRPGGSATRWSPNRARPSSRSSCGRVWVGPSG